MNSHKKFALVLAAAFPLFLGTGVFIGMPAGLTAVLTVILAACGGAALAAGGGVDGRDNLAGRLIVVVSLIMAASTIGATVLPFFGFAVTSLNMLAWAGTGSFIIGMLIGKHNPKLLPIVETVLPGIFCGLIAVGLLIICGVGFFPIVTGSTLAGLGALTLYSNS